MKKYLRLALCALAALILGSVSVDAQNITTVVGGGPVGLTPTVASIGSPVAVRRDSQNNAYILDNTYGRVLKIDNATGLISVYAGNGTVGFSGDHGPAALAQMNGPSGMCIDSNDNLYIADSDNAVIRVVIGAGAVTPSTLTGPVVAGDIYTAVGIQTSTNPEFGGDSGPALSSHLHFPDGCSFDTNGNLYIADRGNNEIRVVLSAAGAAAPPIGLGAGPLTAGNIYRFAGAAGGSFPNPPTGGYGADGSAAVTAAIYGPFDVFVDGSNNVFFADLGNNFGPDGTPNAQAGQPPNNNVVREILATDGTIHTVAGSVTLVAGVPTGQYGSTATGPAVGTAINEPKGISTDAAGNLYFCDTVNQTIRKVSGGNISVVAGTMLHGGFSGDGHAATSATLTFPAGTFIDPLGDLLISDEGSNAIRIVPLVANNGSFLLNNIYTIAGNGHLSFGGDGAAAASGELNTPAGVSVDHSGNILVADSGSDLIRKVGGTPAKLSTIAGQAEANGFLNGATNIAGAFGVLNVALGTATDAAGNIYIADTANCIVRKLTPTGISTIAGFEPPIVNPDNAIANVPKCGFGTPGTAAVGNKIGAVNSVAVDSHGNVFFSDKTNNVVWEVPVVTAGTLVAGNAYVVAGSQTGAAGFGGDGGAANAAELTGPTGIYIDIYDNLFIADAGNHRIREVPALNINTMNAGSIYTIAGNGTSGNTGDGAAATGAELATPFAIVVDNAENVYFSDTVNQTVREISGTSGNISTIAGTKNVSGFGGDGGAATSAHFNVPEGLALQANASPSTTSNLLVSDSVNNRVRSIAGIGNNAPVPLVSFSSNPLVFTAEPQGTASAPVLLTITNTGGAALTISGFSFGGANAGDFTKGTDTCVGTPVPAGQTCTVNVIFTPGALGTRNGSIIVAGAFGSPSATLTGTGGTPTATLNPTSLTFASTTVNTAAPTQTVTLSNTGNAATIVTGITFSGTNHTDYTETDTCVGVVGGIPATTGTCTITVTFKPAAAGASTATMTVASNVAGANTVALSGTGAAATLSLTVKDTDSSSSQTVSAGATATYNLSVSGNQSVTTAITCTGAPAAATCAASPASVAVTPTTAGTFKVTVTTTARGSIMPFNEPSTKLQPPSVMQVVPMASLALLFVIAMMFTWMQNPANRMRTLRVALSACLILMPIAAATMLVGCGGGGGGSTPPPATGTPAGTYTLTVTATSGSTTSSTTLTLVVN